MTNAEFAVLSLIAETSRHGYEIEKTIAERGMREWTEIGFSSIYYLLNKLEKENLIESRTEQLPGRGPARKVYHITPTGIETCRNETLNVLSTPSRCYTPVLLGMANFPSLPVDQALEALKQYRVALNQRLEHIRQQSDQQKPLPGIVTAMFDYSLMMVNAEKKWIDNFIKQLESENE